MKTLTSILTALIIFTAGTAALAADTVSSKRGDYFFYPVQLIDLFTQTFSPKSGSNRNQSSQSIYLKAGKNFDQFEVGGSLYYSATDYDRSEKKTEQSVGLFGQYNFLTNLPENKSVPYVAVHYTIGESNEDDTVDEKIKNTRTYISTGFLYFPWNDMFAVDPNLTYSIRNYESDLPTTYQYTGFNLGVDFRIYF